MRTSIRNIITISATLALAACASSPMAPVSSYWPLVDIPDKDMHRFAQDVSECRRLAATQPGPGSGAVSGALGGAIFGTLLAVAAGSDYSRNSAAGIGAVSGAAGGAASGELGQRDVLRKCVIGRGWNVLN